MQTNSRSIQPGDKILVTGVTGYIASHLADVALRAGYSIRGTARQGSNKVEHLRQLFSAYGDKFEVVEVPDLLHEGAFDEAVKDVDAIAHVASPFVFNVTDPHRDLVQPAVVGTVSLLKSAQQHGNKVKHVVVTSSCASVLHPIEGEEYTYTENDWNDKVIEQFKDWKTGDPFSGIMAYIASKNEAERAVWRYVEEHKPSFGVSTILPSYTYGPVIHSINKPEDINTSVALVFQYFAGKKTEFDPLHPGAAFVDVRDTALAHLRALERSEVSAGQRFITSADTWTYQLLVDLLRKRFPERADIILAGEPGKNYPPPGVVVDGTKATKVLGIEYTSLEDSLAATCESLKRFL